MKKILLLLAVPAMMLAGCAPKSSSSPSNNSTPSPSPVACLGISAALVDSGQTVTTTNCSTNASSYQWNFGQGNASISTNSTPSWTYTSPNTSSTASTKYNVSLVAYSGDKSKTSTKDTVIYLGFRQIDSAVIVSSTLISNGITAFVQMGPVANISEYSTPIVTVNKLPTTFNFESLKLIMSSKNSTNWRGRVFNGATNASICNFGLGTPVYFSRGLNASPIKVTMNDGGEMDVYYHLIKQ